MPWSCRSVACLLLATSLWLAVEAPPAQAQFWRRRNAPRVEQARIRVDVRRLAEAVHEQTNVERMRSRLQPLDRSPALASAAELHSRDMAERGYFSHTTKGWVRGKSFSERLRAAGVSGRRLAENIALLPVRMAMLDAPDGESLRVEPDYEGMAREVVQMWMKSAGHRRNILDGHLDSLGVGCWLGEKSGVSYVYVTQDFGDLR
ncbi:MAG: CAP domain-containing protein [Candidatus Sumerlaeaceae bacterium]|nr:CAP domain-containing protein [Candidatus Sumerlaeaceae bacterium]